MCTVSVESDKIDRIERSMVSVEKNLVRLTVIAEEGAKREERLNRRMDHMESKVEDNTRLIWKFVGGIVAVVTLATVAISFYAATK